MEMEFKDNGRRRKVFLVLGVVLALTAGGAAFYLSSQGTTKAAEVPMRTIIVATQEIPARTVIDTSMLVERQVPVDASVAQAIDDRNAVIGRLSGVTIYADQVISPNLLATGAPGAAFSIISPTEVITADSPAWRAASVLVPKDRAVGGLIEIGQRVDLFVTVDYTVNSIDEEGELVEMPTEEGMLSGKSSKITWTDLELLAKDADADIYVFKVDLNQAEEISHVQASVEGNAFGMVLRPDGDNRVVDTTQFGETTDRFVEQYGFPVPELTDLRVVERADPSDPGDPLASPAPSEAPEEESSSAP